MFRKLQSIIQGRGKYVRIIINMNYNNSEDETRTNM